MCCGAWRDCIFSNQETKDKMDARTLQKLEEIPTRFPSYHIVRRAGAAPELIQSLLIFAGTDLPEDYLDFLRYSNGFSDDLWSVEQILKDRYGVKQFMPGAIPIGSNGGPDVYIMDTRSGDPAQMPCLKINVCWLGWQETPGTRAARSGQWDNFYDLLCYLCQAWEAGEAEAEEEQAEDEEWYQTDKNE